MSLLLLLDDFEISVEKGESYSNTLLLLLDPRVVLGFKESSCSVMLLFDTILLLLLLEDPTVMLDSIMLLFDESVTLNFGASVSCSTTLLM